jgi:cytochrome oxidase Cu insertion factor (SCO1/SenC/PrrC family)
MASNTKSSNRWQVLLIALLFVVPVVGALFWKPTGHVNHGELVEPARLIKDVRLERLDGTPFHFSRLYRKWTLLYVGGQLCDEVCKDNLYKIQQVRLAQSKNAHRVQSVYLVPADGGTTGAQTLIRQHPGMIGLAAEKAIFKQLVEQFEVNSQTPLNGAQRIYVVDPLGNLMMSYPPDADPSYMNKDLRRLLKVSQIG